MKNPNFRRIIAWLVMFSMTMTQATQVVALTLANTPLAATTTSTVRPNIMYVLDDSGSMAWEFTPDYINDSTVAADPGSLGGSVADGVLATVAVRPGPVTGLASSNGSWDKVYALGTPSVVITGGGGTGAAATVTLNATTKKISSINLTSGGTGYTSVPYVTLVGGISNATWGMCWGTTGASNQGGSPKDTTVSPTCSNDTQPPYASGAVNYQYYDPTVYYEAPLKANATRYANSDPTNAWRDGFSGSRTTCSGGGGTCNLDTGWPHEVWCNVSTAVPSAADPTAAGKCRENADTSNDNLYPNVTYTFRKTYNGPASYYTMSPSEYCNDTTYTNCIRSTTPQILSGTTFNVPSYYRWCSYYNPQSHSYGGCQGRRDWSHYIPNYLGGWISSGAAGVQATAGLNVTSVTNGQSIIGVTVNGTDIVGGATFVANGASTTTTIATAICSAVQSNILSNGGYGCSMVGTTALITAASVGTAANGLEIIAAGPPGVAAAYSTGELRVLSVTAGNTITSITITRQDGPPRTVVNLINATVTASGTIDATAKSICEAIKSGPNQATYTARSGVEAEAAAETLTWGTCNASPTGWVGIKRLISDAADNGAELKVLGPPTAVVFSGQIVVNAQSGAARVDDIKIGVTSILTGPRNYAAGASTDSIASDIAANISATGCTAAAVGSVVTISGTTGTCGAAAALTVTANGVSAQGVFKVSPSTNAFRGALGGINVGTTGAMKIIDAVSSSVITDTRDASANATTLSGRINASTNALSNGAGPSGFSAGAPADNGDGSFNVTVTAPAGNTYNGKSFDFLAGARADAVLGTRPSWTFDFTGASTDNRRITSITCGATDTITQSTASTGNASSTDYIANLSTGATTNSLNGRSNAGYSYVCNSAGACTLTGPAGAAACATPTVSADASITFANMLRTNAGGNGTPTWRFNITGATTDSKKINSITCNGVDVISTNTVAAGVAATSANMVQALSTTSSGALNTKNPGSGGYSYSCNASGNCTLSGPPGLAACTAAQLQAGASADAKITLNSFVLTSNGTASSAPTWTFDINGGADAATIGPITCGSTISSTANAGSYAWQRINNLATGLAANPQNSYSTSCTPTLTSASSPVSATCNVVGPAGAAACANLAITKDAGITLSTTSPAFTASKTWTFSFTDASKDGKNVSSLKCGTSSGSPETLNATINTGTALTTYAATLANNIDNASNTSSGTGWNGNSGCNDSGNEVTCSFERTSGAGNRCSGNSAVVSFSSGAHITVKAPGVTESWNGTRYKYDFTLTGIDYPDEQVTQVACSGNSADTGMTSTAATGATGSPYRKSVQRLNNLRTALHGQNNGTYSYSCPTAATNASTQFECVVTGPSSCTATTQFRVVGSDSSGIDVGGKEADNSAQDINVTAGTAAPRGSFNITGATTDAQKISAITCGATSPGNRVITANTVSTGTVASNTTWIPNLKNGLTGLGGYNIASAVGAVAPAQRMVVTGPTGAPACTNLTIPVSGATLSTTSPAAVGGSNGGIPSWTFNVASVDTSGLTADGKTISGITCGGTSTFGGTAPSTGFYDYVRINALAASLNTNGANSYSTSCTPAATAGSQQTTCTITGPANTIAACSSMVLSPDTTITADQPAQVSGTGATRPIWTFNISNATTAAKTIDSISCGGAETFGVGSKPSTGNSTLAAWQRVNNLTQSGGLTSIGANSYTYSCPVATSTSSPITTCTVQGPAGAAACASLTITPEASSGITTGNMTQTSAGGGATAEVENFAPYLSNVTNFTDGYAGLNSTPSNLTSVNQGTIPTDSPSDTPHIMSNANPQSAQTIVTNATGTAPNVLTLAGGLAADASTNNWNGVGIFKRYDITTGSTYNRGSARTDCAGATCSYTEERQNFANWYSYYRTRVLMMKSATTLAFSQLDDKYRIGFDNICGADTGTETTVVRGVSQFSDTAETANARTNWWSSLTGSGTSCATPLRAETAKIGRYFAGKLTGATDPIQYSCQQNFMILVTDGYWNENETTAIKGVSGADIGNQDNTSATAPRPFYDGAQASTTCPAVGGGRGSTNSSCRTLADIAWYYYSTDLRSSTFSNTTITLPDSSTRDVSTNNVMTSADDKNQAQHMNFYAMGLGIDGTLEYRSDYQTASSGDYYDIKQGTRNWPAVANLDPTGVDDLWHATANGHGKYFSARNLPNVVAGLREALNKIGARVGSAAAAATSNLEPVAGDNFAYVASYATVDWVGDLQSRSIDVVTGDVSSDTNCDVTGSGCQWSAQQKLDNMTWSARRIFVKPNSGNSGDSLRPFTYGNLTAAEAAYFSPTTLSQYSTPADAQMTATKLVDFLRGDRSLEQDGDNSHAQLWRRRTHVLGDIVNTQPVFMKRPTGIYTDAGYSDFTSTGTAATRNPVVFISSQDGMLHAINAHTAAVTVSGATVQPGEEMWSYIPQQPLATMKTLADVNYGGQSGANAHRYFIDGPITVADVNFGGSANDWHTIMVAGQGAGGTSYFALDVTDPLNPLFLWEFTHADLGYSFANPNVSKLPNGNWAVFFTSGYNNADGKGYLFAINPETGAVHTGFPMTNNSGSGGSPSNLGKVAIWATDPGLNNTAQYAYAGDLNGDLWRFDLDPSASGHTGQAYFKLAHLAHGATGQPITTKPELTSFTDGTRLVFVGTGKYLESTDLTNSDRQGFYGIKDTLGAPNLGGVTQQTWNPATDTTTVSTVTVPMFLERKLISTDSLGNPITQVVGGVTKSYRKVCRGASSAVAAGTGECTGEDSAAMDWTVYGGWFVDLPDAGERLNVDAKLVRGTLVFATNIPAADSCTVGGSAWINVLDYNSGLLVQGATTASTKIADSLVVGITVVKLASGDYKAIATKSNYQQETFQVPVATSTTPGGSPASSSSFGAKRSLWREFEAY